MSHLRALTVLLGSVVMFTLGGCPTASVSDDANAGSANSSATAETSNTDQPSNDDAAPATSDGGGDVDSTTNDPTVTEGDATVEGDDSPADEPPTETSDPTDQPVSDDEDEEPEEEVVTGASFLIEPDDFDDGTALTDVDTRVTLSTASEDNQPMTNTPVTASDDSFNFAPTGDKVFGHANIQFFNNDRRLRMDFTSPVQGVEIQFAGGTFFETEIGRLELYDEAGNLLEQAMTEPKGAGAAETLAIIRESADIVWAVAYVAADEGSFGRFDALVLTLPVAEP